MKTKIDSATVELDAYLEEFEEKIEETTEKLAKNISSQCEQPKTENSEDENDPMSGKFQEKNSRDQLMVNQKGVPSILRCFQCCEEIPLTTEFLDSITNGLYSQEKQRKFSKAILRLEIF